MSDRGALARALAQVPSTCREEVDQTRQHKTETSNHLDICGSTSVPRARAYGEMSAMGSRSGRAAYGQRCEVAA